MKCIQIYKDGKLTELTLKKNIKLKSISQFLTNSAKSQGNNQLKELYKWFFNKRFIYCYGWYDGEAGFENKYELPPGGMSGFLEEDSSIKLLFGDIFLVLFDEKNNICDYSISEYDNFYNHIFGGFDDCDTEDDDLESINTEEEDEDYNLDNDIIENNDINNSSLIDDNDNDNDNELTEDKTEY